MSRKPLLMFALTFLGCTEADNPSVTQQLCESEGGMSCCPGSPILVDMAGDGIHLTGAADGVVFQLRRDRLGLWAWTALGSDDAFLALDVDGSGRIDNGSELFGDGSTQVASPNPNGFMALAYYDLPDQGGNGDGAIDDRDAVWSRLQLWRDTDHDAFSSPSELSSVGAAGVHAFSLRIGPSAGFDAYGNEFRVTSTIVADAPISAIVNDVWLVQAPLPVDPADPVGGLRDYTQWTCWAWQYAVQYCGSSGDCTMVCNISTVQNDPIVMALGQSVRLVAKSSTSTVTRAIARDRAYNAVGTAVVGPMGSGQTCHGVGFPDPDPYHPPPYEAIGNWFTPRVKCFEQVIHEGGGGGC